MLQPFDTDVLVVGAGPTGLMAALELSRRGLRVRILDKRQTPSDKSRALVMQVRSLEIFAALGLIDQVLALGLKAKGVSINMRGRHVATGRFDDIGVPGTAYSFLMVISQAETEGILTSALTAQGVHIERGVEAKSFAMDDDGVTTELVGGAIRSRYIIGADGAHSMVRHALGIPFEGEAYAQRFLLADADVSRPLPPGLLNIWFGATGVAIYFPFKKDGFGRMIIADHKPEAQQSELTVAEVNEAVAYYTGPDLTLSNPEWLSRFHLHHRLAAAYGKGRAFLAGDAAHIHSPLGGQGMNTGLQDAYNLAWKMALALQLPKSAPRLLTNYDSERRPVGKFLMTRTDQAFKFVATSSRIVGAARDVVVRILAPILLGSRRVRPRLFRFVSQIGIRYRRSDLNGESVSSAPAAFSSLVRPGDRLPDVQFADGRWLHAAALKGRTSYVWLLLGEADAVARDAWRAKAESAARDLGKLVECLAFAVDAGITRTLGADAAVSYLVRPDGHVAFRTYGTDVDSTVAHLKRLYH